MKQIISDFRVRLGKLIDDEQRVRGLDTGQMIALLQSHVALPAFYRDPAQALAAGILQASESEFEKAALGAALQEATKAVYGAWIRENYRSV